MATLDVGFWRGKKVFLTGHTGFKGSWLAEWLTVMGSEVTAFSLQPEGELNHFELLKPKYESIAGDIRDLEKIKAAIHASKPEIVFHLAAQALVRPSYSDPVGTYATNVMGTLHVMEAMRATPSVRVGIMVTSDKCYENNESGRPYREQDPMGGYDPYSSSKGCAELLVASLRRSFFNGDCKIASVRAGNVIGGGDWAADRLIPDIVRAWAAKKPVQVRNPKSVRPWQHVMDPLSGYLQLAQEMHQGSGDLAKGWNFGPDWEAAWPVERILQSCIEFLPGFRYEIHEKPEHEAKLLTLDSTQAASELGWRSTWNIEHALQSTFEWYRDFYENRAIRTDQQIQEFMNTGSLRST